MDDHAATIVVAVLGNDEDVPAVRFTISNGEKNRWLEGWLLEKLHQRQVRFYEEPTVLFDE